MEDYGGVGLNLGIAHILTLDLGKWMMLYCQGTTPRYLLYDPTDGIEVVRKKSLPLPGNKLRHFKHFTKLFQLICQQYD
jgi:hypothetical protein